MVFAAEMEEAVEEEDFDLDFEGVVEGSGLAGGGVEGDGEVAGVLGGDFEGRGEAEDVGGLIFAAVGAVEALELGVGGEEDVDFALEADGGAGTVEEARESRLRDGGITWGFDGDHRSGLQKITEGQPRPLLLMVPHWLRLTGWLKRPAAKLNTKIRI